MPPPHPPNPVPDQAHAKSICRGTPHRGREEATRRAPHISSWTQAYAGLISMHKNAMLRKISMRRQNSSPLRKENMLRRNSYPISIETSIRSDSGRSAHKKKARFSGQGGGTLFSSTLRATRPEQKYSLCRMPQIPGKRLSGKGKTGSG